MAEMNNNNLICQIFTTGYCPYADGVDEEVSSCKDCPYSNPEEEKKFFEEVKQE